MDYVPYWKRQATRGSLSRRTFLQGTGVVVAGVGGSALVGCGNDDDDPISPTADDADDTSPTPSNGSDDGDAGAAEPRRGGTFRMAVNVDNRIIDPYATSAATVKGLATHVYSRLYRIRPEPPDEAGAISMTPEPDVAESTDVSDDGLTYTIKLRENARWHPPVNRPVTADDVVFSWERFMGILPGTTPAVNSEKLTFVDNVQALDDHTVQFNLNTRYGPFFTFLSDTTTLALMPMETGTEFDPAQVMVGSGPWMFDSWEPDVRYSFTRFDDWHLGPEAPYFDALEINVVPEYTQRLNNFLAGNLEHHAVDGLDFAQVQQRIPDVKSVIRANSSIYGIAFSEVTDERPDAPWTDVRVRRAISMAINRDELEEVCYNRSSLEAAGLQLPDTWGGYVPPIFATAFLDPRDSRSAEFMQYDPAAARALLDEAGGGFSARFHYAPAYGRVPTTATEMIIQYLSEIGIELEAESEDYPSRFVPYTYAGDFHGVAMAGQGGFPDPGNFLEGYYSATSQRNPSRVDDPRVEEFIAEYYGELDEERRVEIIREWQEYLYENMYNVPTGMIGDSHVVVYQPYVHGPQEHVAGGYGFGGEATPYFWREA